jgi:hypothetical protein
VQLSHRGLGKGALLGMILAPLGWMLLGRPGTHDRRETPADANCPRPTPRPPALSREEAGNVLRGLLADWAWQETLTDLQNPSRDRECGTPEPGRFVKEWAAHGTVLRLLSLGYPEAVEGWAQRAAEGPHSDGWERSWALFALGILGEAGQGGAESVLVRLCRDPNDFWRWVAQYRLANADPGGAHRPLYRNLAVAGDDMAMDALSRWPDPESVAILKEPNVRWTRRPAAHAQAKISLERLEALSTGGWNDLARAAILEEPGPQQGLHFTWALRIGRERRPPWLARTLRERLEIAYRYGSVRLSLTDPTILDDAFDDVLLTLSDLGGDLSDEEKAYLRHYGYRCDPRQRLAEILAERASPR